MASTINAQTTPFAAIVQTADNTGNLAFQTANVTALTIDTSQNVGIGTTSPSYKLDVAGSAGVGIRYKSSGSYGTFLADNTSGTGGGSFAAYQNGSQKAAFGVSGAIEGNTSTDGAIFVETGGSLRFYTNGSPSEKMRLDSSGNLGIGTSSPSYKLHVSAAGNGTKARFTNGTTTLDLYCGGSEVYTGTAGSATSWAYDNANTYIAGYVNGSEKMRLDSSGNLGIGTSSPSTKLVVVGDWVSGQATVKAQSVTSFASGGTTGYGIFDSDGSRKTYLYANASLTVLGTTGSYPIAFETNSTERMRIASDGTVTVGGYNVLGVGVAQTWQDVAGSRSLGTTYTNSTGKPIQLGYWVRSTGTTTLTVVISGVTVYTQAVGGVQYVTQIIPIGATYSVSANNISSSAWLELR